MKTKITKNESRKNGTIAQQSDICKSNINDLYIAYVFDHQEMTFRDVVIGISLNVALTQAALLVDRNTVEFGSLARELDETGLSYRLGFITLKEMACRVDDLYFSETLDGWDEPFRMWTNIGSGITIGMASLGEMIPLLPDKNLIELIQQLEDFVNA